MAGQTHGDVVAVFLSASVPDPLRDAKYFETADVTSIREAVRALTMVVLMRSHLVFGGHPAISPLIVVAARQLGRQDRVHIFQSEFFRDVVPPESLTFPWITWTPRVDGDRSPNLLLMRERMLDSAVYSAGIFIGGMDGVEEEFELFKQRHPQVPAYPVASTGGASLELWRRHTALAPKIRQGLADEVVYDALFRSLPGVGREE